MLTGQHFLSRPSVTKCPKIDRSRCTRVTPECLPQQIGSGGHVDEGGIVVYVVPPFPEGGNPDRPRGRAGGGRGSDCRHSLPPIPVIHPTMLPDGLPLGLARFAAIVVGGGQWSDIGQDI
jgi:hypothetical protein